MGEKIENQLEETPNSKAQRVAAHIDDDILEEQVEDIINYIEFIKQKNQTLKNEKN
ncbi:hypothetical protein [Enterococcus sp. AZ109]|uniref:hypothetical protein n=1 Tax=Enterococcus sp. AZ109 TaxID=2774634 RepID=UPI003F6889C6